MTVALPRLLGLLSLAAAALGGGAGIAVVIAVGGPEPALVLVAGIALLGYLILNPWAGMPVVLVGGALGDAALGLDNVTGASVSRTALLALAGAAVAIRRFDGAYWGARVRTPADRLVIAFALYVLAEAVLGLTLGNDSHEILVATYQLLLLPALFFLVTFTLNDRERFWSAARLFAAGALVVALLAYSGSGRQGGLISSLALPGVLVLATRVELRGTERIMCLGLAAVFVTDIALAGYRAVWVAAAISIALLALRSARTRRTVLGAAACTLLVALLAVSVFAVAPFTQRVDVAGSELNDASGYRGPESTVGLSMVAASPLVGGGLGRVEPDQYLESLGYADVGPVFHAFPLTVAVNTGVIGLFLVAAFLLVAARRRGPPGSPEAQMATAMRCILGGWAVAALFAGPTDGHWELGVLPALALVLDRFVLDRQAIAARRPPAREEAHRATPHRGRIA